MTTVWIYTLVCLSAAQGLCSANDPALFPPAIETPSKEECIQNGFAYMKKMRLPERYWVVVCFEGVKK